jgi:CRISPR/Cas system type I-B associated protein Csh2 (Cas7 group RAMP superfamily)
MQETTTVRIDRTLRERLRRVEHQLGISTGEAISRAVDALHQDLLWRRVESHYARHPDLTDDDADWIGEVQRAQR